MTFSERAKPLKEKSKLTLYEIAMACNISESMVSRYINGQIIPPEDVARNILELLEKTSPKVEVDENMNMALSMIREVYEARVEDLRSSIKDLKTEVTAERKEKWIFFTLFAVVIVFSFILLYVDLSNGHIGWFRH